MITTTSEQVLHLKNMNNNNRDGNVKHNSDHNSDIKHDSHVGYDNHKTIKQKCEEMITEKDDEIKFKILNSIDKKIMHEYSEMKDLIELMFEIFTNDIWMRNAIMLLCPFCTSNKTTSISKTNEQHQKFCEILDLLNKHINHTNISDIISDNVQTNTGHVTGFIEHYVSHFIDFDTNDIINITSKFSHNFTDVINLFKTKFRSNICINDEFIDKIKKTTQ
jgi:hypothetical protein